MAEREIDRARRRQQILLEDAAMLLVVRGPDLGGAEQIALTHQRPGQVVRCHCFDLRCALALAPVEEDVVRRRELAAT
jgi:hypothetical protein